MHRELAPYYCVGTSGEGSSELPMATGTSGATDFFVVGRPSPLAVPPESPRQWVGVRMVFGENLSNP